jgi:hypothetical protein
MNDIHVRRKKRKRERQRRTEKYKNTTKKKSLYNSKNDEGPPSGSCNTIDDFNPLPLPIELPPKYALPFFNLRPSTTIGKKLRPRNDGLTPAEPKAVVAGESGDASEGGGGAGIGEAAKEVEDDNGIEEVVFGFNGAEVAFSLPPTPTLLPLNNDAGIWIFNDRRCSFEE